MATISIVHILNSASIFQDELNKFLPEPTTDLVNFAETSFRHTNSQIELELQYGMLIGQLEVAESYKKIRKDVLLRIATYVEEIYTIKHDEWTYSQANMERRSL